MYIRSNILIEHMNYFIATLLIIWTTNTFSQSLSVEKIWKAYAFYAKNVAGFSSMKDGIHFTRLNEHKGEQHIAVYDIRKQDTASKIILPKEKLYFKGQQIIVDDYSLNTDETKILLTTEKTSVYRRSYLAVHYLYDIVRGELQALDEAHQPQTLVEYAPDGKKVAYIFQNNIYVKDLETQKVRKLTTDGSSNTIINGATDWVYEEEFALTKAYAWSPDSKYISYLKFNEKDVKAFQLTYYKAFYPDTYTYKYPKAGEANSKVSAHILDYKTGKSRLLELGAYEYIPRLRWASNDNKLILQTLNRHQNHLKYHIVDLSEKKSVQKVFFEEKSDTYIDIDDHLMMLSDGQTLLRTSDQSGYNHIYQLTLDGKQTQITQGNFDIIELYGIDERENRIYYAAAEKDATTKGIYSIRLDGSEKRELTPGNGYNEAAFTHGMTFFVKTHSDANTPPVYTLCDQEGKEISVLQDNLELRTKLNNLQLSKKEFLVFKSGEETLNGWMIKPPDFNPAQKYPVYINIYGGPGHNEVLDTWDGNDYMYHQLLAQKGYIVVSVDPHGTLYRGAKFKKSTYMQLGKLELEDLINVARELQTYAYVDPQRIGIQGWSYGGFMASLAMTKGADYFKMGIAVAPVTHWGYYDNIYTERFMRTPLENEKGYEENSPIHYVEQLKGKYLLIHGSGDDNVHYQNTMEMINALVRANKQFDLFIYPNRNHGIYGGNTRNHLFHMMLDYTLKYL